jgi:N6-adenosine-specific RNA methylase IME4
VRWPFGALRPFSYDVIVVDPPWDFVNYTDAGTRKSADPHYDVMPLADIKALPIGYLARQDAILLLWSTGAMLPSRRSTPGVRSTSLRSSGGR